MADSRTTTPGITRCEFIATGALASAVWMMWKNSPMPPPGRIGFRILPSPPRLDASLVDAFRGVASSNVADAMGRFGFMDPGIQSRSGLPLCGLAITVSARPGDNLMVHKALQVAEPGDIVVGDRDGIAVVPRADAAEVLELVRALIKNEERRVAEIQSGTVFKADIDETLRKKGVIE